MTRRKFSRLLFFKRIYNFFFFLKLRISNSKSFELGIKLSSKYERLVPYSGAVFVNAAFAVMTDRISRGSRHVCVRAERKSGRPRHRTNDRCRATNVSAVSRAAWFPREKKTLMVEPTPEVPPATNCTVDERKLWMPKTI